MTDLEFLEQSGSNQKKSLWTYFSTYEKLWLLIFCVIAIVASIVMPEDSVNGIDGTVITIFCVVSTIICLVCELLAAKQSKWNAFIYIFVEILEVIRFLMIAAIANMLVCLLFWLPMHIITFINWNKHKDANQEEVTEVRSLNLKGTLILVAGIVVWTLVIGYLLARFMPDTEFFSSEGAEVAAAYLDACSSALAVVNGVLFYLRYIENWYAWMLFSVLQVIYMALSGFWIFIVLQLGYITNIIYGYFKWSKYIQEKQATNQDLNEVENVKN